MKEFGLTLEHTRVMFSYRYHLTLADIEYETIFDKKELKRKWLYKWRDSTELFLKIQLDKNSSTNSPFGLITDFSLLKKQVEIIQEQLENKFTLFMILLEVILFKPDYCLSSNEQQFKNLEVYNEKKIIEKLEFFCGHTGDR